MPLPPGAPGLKFWRPAELPSAVIDSNLAVVVADDTLAAAGTVAVTTPASLVAQTSKTFPTADGGTTDPIDTTGANLLFLHFTHDVSVNFFTVSDNKGNSWSINNAISDATSGAVCRDRTYTAVFSGMTVGPGHTVTVTGVGSKVAIQFLAWSSSTAPNFDQINYIGGALPHGSGGITESFPNELIITSFSGASTPTSVDAPFTILNTIGPGTNNYATSVAYYIRPATGTVDPLWYGSGNAAVTALGYIGTWAGVVGGPATGTLVLTEAADTLAATGNVPVIGGGGPVTYLVSSYTPGTTRNDFTGQVGLIFSPDTTRPMRFDKIGLRKGTGNTGNHTVNLYAFPGAFATVGAVLRTAEVDLTSGTVGTFYYTDIPEITLTYNTPYLLVAETTASDGQFWPNADGSVTLSLLGGNPVYAGHVTAGSQAQQNTANDMFYGVDLAFSASASTITGLTNVAASANGGLAIASSTYSSAYLPAFANDGSRDPTTNGGWGVGGGWNSALGSYPHTFDVLFTEFHLVHEIDVITLRDNFTVPAAPTLTDTFTSYGIVDYLVQYWDGSAYQTIATVTGNNKVWRQFTFTPVLTCKIRISVSLAVDGYARLVEVEAWAEPAAAGGITGTLVITEAADTLSAAGTVGVSGTLTVNEAADTISAAAGPVVGGTLSRTEAADTITSTGTLLIGGTLGITEVADTVSAAGVVGTAPAVGTLVLTEAPDTISAAGTVRVSGTLGVVEAADTLAATGGPVARGTLSLTEAADTIVAAGGPVVGGTLSVTQANQTLIAIAVSAVGGVLNVTEAADILAATGEVIAFDEVTGTLVRTQENNTLVATGYRVFFSGEPGTVPITPGDRVVPTGQGERTIVSGATTRMLYDAASQDVRAVVSDAKPRLIMAASLRRVVW